MGHVERTEEAQRVVQGQGGPGSAQGREDDVVRKGCLGPGRPSSCPHCQECVDLGDKEPEVEDED